MRSFRLGQARPNSTATASRRGVIRTSLAGAMGAAVTLGSGPPATATAREPARGGPGAFRLRWFGTNAWEVGVGGRTILIDPWLSRFSSNGNDGELDPATRLTVDDASLDRHLSAADLILVTHGHYDHIGDVPAVLRKFPRARVVATQTHAHLMSAMGAPADRIIWARGGECLDFGDYTVRVLPSLHSLMSDYRYFAPGTLAAPPRSVRTVADLLEGGTLAYHITAADGGASILNIGTANVIERELLGLRPDVALLAVPSSSTTHEYLRRAMTAMDNPRVVVATHHDALDTPLSEAPRVNGRELRSFREELGRLSPSTTVVEPEYCDPFTL